jgi:hypothetical protein
MYIYLITRNGAQVDYDQTEAVVVAADTPKQARELATVHEYRTDPAEWYSAANAKLVKLGTAAPRIKKGVIHRDIHAG